MAEIRYLTKEQLVEINKRVLKENRVKRADSPRVASRSRLDYIIKETQQLEGDQYEKAACLLIGITRGHAFDSGNRRTAYAAAKVFLEANGLKLEVEPEARILMGVREGFYKTAEIVEWLKGNAIRDFRRA